MGLVEKIQEKSREEYKELARTWAARFTAKVQERPIPYFVGGIVAGIFLVLLRNILVPLIGLLAVIAIVIYLIAPTTKTTV